MAVELFVVVMVVLVVVVVVVAVVIVSVEVHFFPKYWVNIYILGLYKSYLTVVQNGPIQKLPHGCPKLGGGGQGPFRTMSKKILFFMASLREDI